MRLDVVHLKRYFADVKAVDDVSFQVESGQIYGFVGPNGAGKTTTMRILATLDEPTAGDALLDGVSVVQQPERARRAIGYMPDHLPSHRDLTVDDYLDFFARAYGLRGRRRRRTVASIEEFTRLTSLRERTIQALSKGMKQRLSLARALIHDPGILILDEPAAGLDPRARVELRELLLALAGQGKAVLISSHILTELSEICDGAVILEHGRMVHAGSLRGLLRAAERQTVVRLRVLEADGDGRLVRELLTAPRVTAARPVGEEVEVELEGGEAAAAELLAALIAAGHRVVEFRPRRGGLEEVFMSVTTGDLQ
jgi:ABC-2 type transport system ATP-binding protein